MQLSVNIILYDLQDIDPVIKSKRDRSEKINGVRLWNASEPLTGDKILYVCHARELPEEGADVYVRNWFLIVEEGMAHTVMNRLFDLFYRLSEWDKDMHVAALEGKSIQELIDLSEPVLERPMIVFDASFDVMAYTKNIPCEYPVFWETIKNGYTNPDTMEKLKRKQIFSKIRQDSMLIAPAADAEGRINIYLQFFSHQSLLGYTSIFQGEENPMDGYLDLVRMFMGNMSFCLRRDFENQRHGQMMYETFLSHLADGATISRERLEEQASLIDGLPVRGRFTLGILRFSRQDHIPLPFLARMLSRQFWNIKPFIHEKDICLLKIEREDLKMNPFLETSEMEKLNLLLENYEYAMGISNSFFDIEYLRDACVQAKAALKFGVLEQKRGKLFYYKDYYYFHLFESVEHEMSVCRLQSDLYVRLSEYDRQHGSRYCQIILCYLRNDCSATYTAKELGVHRNTVRNMLQFMEKTFCVNMTDTDVKTAFVLSDFVKQYLELKERQ